MQYRQLGASDMKVSVVGFGAWAVGGWKWGGADDVQSVRAITHALDCGITLIDTAPIYGCGHSETVVGRAIAGRRDEVVVATKCGLRWDLDYDTGTGETSEGLDGKPITIQRCLRRESIRHELEQSLRRLGIERIDLYQCHAPDPNTPVEDTMAALLELRDEGKIRHIGVSNFHAGLLQRAVKAGDVTSSQNMYNLILRGIEEDLLPFCRENGLGLLAYTPLLLGLLTGKVTLERAFPEGDLRRGHHLFTPRYRSSVLDMLEGFGPIAEKHGATRAQLAIHWVFRQPGVTAALVGARNEVQAAENAAAASFVLDPDGVGAMTELAAPLRA